MSESRLLPVPDGLDGLRLDVALARLFGFSRTAAAELVDTGRVTVDGAAPPRSAKVRGGSWLESELRCRSAARFWHTPEEVKELNGFRLCRSPLGP